MSRITREEREEHRSNATYFVGRAAALEELVDGLLTESGAHWANKRTEIAGYLRDTLVPRLKERAIEERKQQKKEEVLALETSKPEETAR